MESNQIHKELLKLINIERTFQQNASIDFSHTLLLPNGFLITVRFGTLGIDLNGIKAEIRFGITSQCVFGYLEKSDGYSSRYSRNNY